MEFTMNEGCQKVLDFDVVEGSHAYNSANEYYRDWDKIPQAEQEELCRLRDELEAVFMKAMKVGKAS